MRTSRIIWILLVALCLALFSEPAGATSYFYYYAQVEASVADGEGEIYVSDIATTTPQYEQTSTAENSIGKMYPSNTNLANDGGRSVPFFLYARPKDGQKFLGWSLSPTRPAVFITSEQSYEYSAITAMQGTYDTIVRHKAALPNVRYDRSISTGNYNEWVQYIRRYHLYAYFGERKSIFYAYCHPVIEGGTYTVNGIAPSTIASETDAEYLSLSLQAQADEGYEFFGWYSLNETGEKIYIGHQAACTLRIVDDTHIYAEFIVTSGVPIFEYNGVRDYDLERIQQVALSQGGGQITLVRDGVLTEGSYTIHSGIHLLIPYDTSATYETTRAKIVTGEGQTLTQYRTLTFASGSTLTIEQGASLCVAGQQLSASAGNVSGAPTGACGAIDMRRGGHIDVYGALYCYGFILGQNMLEGNNTIHVGTITAHPGSQVWENFAIGDWRGGTITMNLGETHSDYRVFPFNSYFIQNIEVPVTYKYGAKERCVVSLYAASANTHIETDMELIGTNDALFLLHDAGSEVTKWYDATTDHLHVRLSGTAELSHLVVSVYGTDVDSRSFFLPIPSNMHLSFDKCHFTLSDDVNIQPGAVLEVNKDSKLTIASNVVLYDTDEWGQYAHGYYFRTMDDTLTPHYKRNGKQMTDIDDARIIVDGQLVVATQGALWSTASGAAVVSHGGGSYVLNRNIPANYTVNQYRGTGWSESNFVPIRVTPARLRSDNDAFTATTPFALYRNLYRRWFVSEAMTSINADNTYNFTYLSTPLSESSTDMVSKCVYTINAAFEGWWMNVVEAYDSYANTFRGDDGNYYNFTTLSEWLCLVPTATNGLYEGSDNNLYTYDTANQLWLSVGIADAQCLYTVDGEKKALVQGNFVKIAPNDEDEAWHSVGNPSQYYLCFDGCRWLPATKIAGQQQAYTVGSQDYIWFEFGWLAVTYKSPYYYSMDEAGLPVYYEYSISRQEWLPATPSVRISSSTGAQDYMDLAQAFQSASSLQNVTITLLKDIDDAQVPISFATTMTNNTTTFDLNGYTLRVKVNNWLTINSATGTFIIDDSSDSGQGCLLAELSANSTVTPLMIQKGTVSVRGGRIVGHNTGSYNASTAAQTAAAGVVIQASGKLQTSGGRIEAYAQRQAYGIYNLGTYTLSGGSIIAEAEHTQAYGLYNQSTALVTLDGAVHVQAIAHGQHLTAPGRSLAVGVYQAINKSRSTIKTDALIEAYCTNELYGQDAYGILGVSGAMLNTFTGATVRAVSAYQNAVAFSGSATYKMVDGGNIYVSAPQGGEKILDLSGGKLTIVAGNFSHDTGLASCVQTPGLVVPIYDKALLRQGYRYQIANSYPPVPPPLPVYTIRFFMPDGTLLQNSQVEEGDEPVCEIPSIAPTESTMYSFSEWNPAIHPATKNEDYTAVFVSSPRQYTITWQNNEGSVLATSTHDYGTMPACPVEPTCPSTATEVYQFNHTWSYAGMNYTETSLPLVTGDATYTACYDVAERYYTIRFLNYDNSQLMSQSLRYGETPIPPTATREDADGFSYSFTSWTPTIAPVSKDQSYKAQYTKTAINYDIIFRHADGTILQERGYRFGAMPACASPTMEHSVFAFWQPEIEPVTEAAVYDAVFYVENTNGDHAYHLSNDANTYYIPYEGGWVHVNKMQVETLRAQYPYSDAVHPDTKYYYENGLWHSRRVIYVANGDKYLAYRDISASEVYIEQGGYMALGGGYSYVHNTEYLRIQASEQASGQLNTNTYNEGSVLRITRDIHYEYIFRTPTAMRWYELGVPFSAMAGYVTTPEGDTLRINTDYDIEVFTHTEATKGREAGWVRINTPSTIIANRTALRIRFHAGKMPTAVRFGMKEASFPILFRSYGNGYMEFQTTSSTDTKNSNWMALPNTALYQAGMERLRNEVRTELGQVYNSETESSELLPLATAFPVGRVVHVQTNKTQVYTSLMTPATETPAMAPYADVTPAENEYRFSISTLDGEAVSTTVLRATASAHNAYTIDEDLRKLTISTRIPQLWIANYNTELCLNTVPIPTNKTTIPLRISAPADGTYLLHTQRMAENGLYMYLAKNGEVLSKLTRDYPLTLTQGTTSNYSIILSKTEIPNVPEDPEIPDPEECTRVVTASAAVAGTGTVLIEIVEE